MLLKHYSLLLSLFILMKHGFLASNAGVLILLLTVIVVVFIVAFCCLNLGKKKALPLWERWKRRVTCYPVDGCVYASRIVTWRVRIAFTRDLCVCSTRCDVIYREVNQRAYTITGVLRCLATLILARSLRERVFTLAAVLADINRCALKIEPELASTRWDHHLQNKAVLQVPEFGLKTKRKNGYVLVQLLNSMI